MMNLLIQNVQNTEKNLPHSINLLMLLICFLASFSIKTKNQKVCGIIFVLSHGRSAVERGFSVIKQLLVENLPEKSLVSQRIVYDHINSNEIKVQEYDLPSDLLKSCKLANSRYITALEKVRKQKDDNVISKKRRLVDEEITLMKKKEEVLKCIDVLNKDAEKMYIEAEEKRNFDLRTKANSFRKTVSDKQTILKDIDDSITKMEQSKKGLN